MNYIVVCLDACRYDTVVKAHTPNFDSIGKVREVYSTAGWTVPSLVAMFTNTPFYNQGSKKFIEAIPFDREWLFTNLKRMGYHTSIITANPWVHLQHRIFSKDVDRTIGKDWSVTWDARRICYAMLDEFRSHDKVFTFGLFMATHHPYGKDHQSKGTKFPHPTNVTQVEAVESIDTELGKILPFLYGTDTEITICADHGDILPQEQILENRTQTDWGHNPAYVNPDMRVFSVPFIRGKI